MLDTKTIFNHVKNNGGITYNTKNNSVHTGGYIVASAGCEQVKENFTQKDIDNYVRQYQKVLSQDNAFLGMWLDTESNLLYFDVSLVYDNLLEALQAGKENKQLAIFDSFKMEEIRL